MTAIAVAAGTWTVLSVPIALVAALAGVSIVGILIVVVLIPLCAIAGYRVAYVEGY